MRTVDFRIEVLRGNIPYERLTYSSPPTLYMDADAEIKLTLRGVFLQNANIIYLQDELRPVMTIDGVDYNLGVYRIATRQTNGSEEGVITDTVEAYDRAIVLTWAKLENRDYWAAGTAYLDVVQSYLTRAGISLALIVPTAAVLQSDRADWDIGTPYLTIINTLLREINYNDLYFDLDGVAHVEPYKAPNAAEIDHTYGADAGIKVLRPEFSKEIDLFQQPNVFIAILENPEYPEPLVATAVNDTPSSPLSTISRGIRIPQVFKVNNIGSAEDLQTYVNRIRENSMMLSEAAEIQTALMPGHNCNDTIAVLHPDLNGLFREKGWSMTLQIGTYMRHTLERVVLLYE